MTFSTSSPVFSSFSFTLNVSGARPLVAGDDVSGVTMDDAESDLLWQFSGFEYFEQLIDGLFDDGVVLGVGCDFFLHGGSLL